MFDAHGTVHGTIEVFSGRGSRLNRVHIFDTRTGRYVTCGFTRGHTLFVRKPVDLASVTIRQFDRRESRVSRLAARQTPAAAQPSARLQRASRPLRAAGTMPA